MRFVKILGAALVAVMASMALIGAATASAAHVQGLCLKNQQLCEAQWVIDPPANGGWLQLLAHAGAAELSNNAFFKSAEKCESNVGVKVSETMKTTLKGEVTELTFFNCSGPCTTAESKGLPWTNGEVTMASEANTEYSLMSKEGGAQLSGCTFGTKCEYSVPAGGSVLLKGSPGASGEIYKAEGVTLKYKSGSGEFLCGSTGTWTAEYVATELHLKSSSNVDLGLHQYWDTLLEG